MTSSIQFRKHALNTCYVPSLVWILTISRIHSYKESRHAQPLLQMTKQGSVWRDGMKFYEEAGCGLSALLWKKIAAGKFYKSLQMRTPRKGKEEERRGVSLGIKEEHGQSHWGHGPRQHGSMWVVGREAGWDQRLAQTVYMRPWETLSPSCRLGEHSGSAPQSWGVSHWEGDVGDVGQAAVTEGIREEAAPSPE